MRDFTSKFYILRCSKGVIRFKSGAYTLVREHFVTDHNTAIEQNMEVFKYILTFSSLNHVSASRPACSLSSGRYQK